MICVPVRVQHESAGYRLDHLGQPRDRLRLAAFAKVWYTLDDAFHGWFVNSESDLRA